MAAATKPTTDPRWAATVLGVDASANIVVPPAGALDTGWVPPIKPPAQWMNWLANLQAKWLAYLRDYELQSHAWATGSDLIGSRVFAVGTTRQLIDTFQGTVAHVRVYMLPGCSLELVLNASWNGTQWVADATGGTAAKYVFSGASVTTLRKAVTTSAWADSGWDSNTAVVGVGASNIVLASQIAAPSSNYSALLATLSPDGYCVVEGGFSTTGIIASLAGLFQLPVGFRPGARGANCTIRPDGTSIYTVNVLIPTNGAVTLANNTGSIATTSNVSFYARFATFQ